MYFEISVVWDEHWLRDIEKLTVIPMISVMNVTSFEFNFDFAVCLIKSLDG